MREKIKLSGVPETMLQTIYARAKESRGRGAIHDAKAEELIEKLDYDFSLADKDTAMRGGVIQPQAILLVDVKFQILLVAGAGRGAFAVGAVLSPRGPEQIADGGVVQRGGTELPRGVSSRQRLHQRHSAARVRRGEFVDGILCKGGRGKQQGQGQKRRSKAAHGVLLEKMAYRGDAPRFVALGGTAGS